MTLYEEHAPRGTLSGGLLKTFTSMTVTVPGENPVTPMGRLGLRHSNNKGK